ncbi:MAG: hypothetical protein ACI9O6_000445 [Glaciecola sp.]|jgi:hypothetical protein
MSTLSFWRILVIFSIAIAVGFINDSNAQEGRYREFQNQCSSETKSYIARTKNRAARTYDDCLKILSNGQILKVSGSVAAGDASRIQRAIYSNRGAVEVRLDSGGGNSAEGMKIGLVFRSSKLLIRVANGSSCASACTVAFLGGSLRTIDSNAQFLVHIYSGFMNGFDRLNGYDFNTRRSEGFIWKDKLLSHPREFLLSIAKNQHGLLYSSVYPSKYYFEEDNRRGNSSIKVARRFNYLKSMIQALDQSFSYEGMTKEANRLTRMLQQKRIQSFNHYVEHQLDADINSIAEGGRSAAHQIAMRIERETAFNMIAGICELNENKEFSFVSSTYKPWLVADQLFTLCKTSRFDEQVSSLNRIGNRSNLALRMIITMFESRIRGVSELSQETLFNYGFTNVE